MTPTWNKYPNDTHREPAEVDEDDEEEAAGDGHVLVTAMSW